MNAINDATGAITLDFSEDEMSPSINEVSDNPTMTVLPKDTTPIKEAGNKDIDFPFNLSDIEAWVIKRKDGSIVRYVLEDFDIPGKHVTKPGPTPYVNHGWSRDYSLSGFCIHTPTPEKPIFTYRGFANPVNLCVGDNSGAKIAKGKFDFVIDGGNVIYPYESSRILRGDEEVVTLLAKHTLPEMANKPRIVHLEWADRQAPPVHPQFWVDLSQMLYGDVMTSCQGGHGRSGSAAVILMMNWTDYSALEAIIHLRAVHCPRAIESTVQHDYINWVARYLGREANAHDAEKITDYKAAFLKLTSPFAKEAQDVLNNVAPKVVVTDAD